MEEPRLGERYWDGLPGGSGLGMEGGTLTEARLSGHRASTWETGSGTDCSHESLRNKCEDSPVKGGSRDERAEEGRKEPPEPEKAAALR